MILIIEKENVDTRRTVGTHTRMREASLISYFNKFEQFNQKAFQTNAAGSATIAKLNVCANIPRMELTGGRRNTNDEKSGGRC